jgi:hypothetical protein
MVDLVLYRASRESAVLVVPPVTGIHYSCYRAYGQNILNQILLAALDCVPSVHSHCVVVPRQVTHSGHLVADVIRIKVFESDPPRFSNSVIRYSVVATVAAIACRFERAAMKVQ